MSPWSITDKTFQKVLRHQLRSKQQDAKYTDVTLVVEDVVIPCHKVILCSASPYFDAMFSHNFKESATSRVELKDISATTVQSLVQYMYTSKIDIHLENVQDLFQACELMDLFHLQGVTKDFMLQHVKPSNCISLYKLAKLYNIAELEQKSKECQLTLFDKVITGKEFLGLSEGELIEYVSDDSLEVDSEDIVFEAMLAWVNAEPKSRRACFVNIVEYVRFPFCTADYLGIVVRQEPLMSSNHACQQLLIDALYYQLRPELRPTRPRVLQKKFLCGQLVVIGGRKKDNTINTQCYFLKKERAQAPSWEVLTHIPSSKLRNYKACATDEGIVVTGGYNDVDGPVLNRCWLFEASVRQWKRLPSMSYSRFSHGAAYYDSAVYVMGGHSGDDFLDSVERFDVKEQRWSVVPPMKKALESPAAVNHQDHIYVFSGWNLDWSRSVQEFNPARNEWCFRSSMPELCQSGAAVSMGGVIYIVGGNDRTCLSYQPSTDSWIKLFQPKEKHTLASAVAWQDRILLGGGSSSRLIEEYNPMTNKWSSWDLPLMAELACHQMLAVKL